VPGTHLLLSKAV